MSEENPYEEHESKARIRRAPKYPVFIVIGAALGAIAALIATSIFEVDPAVGFAATFGYLALYGVPAGALLGAVVAVVLDRWSSRHARTVSMTVERPERD